MLAFLTGGVTKIELYLLSFIGIAVAIFIGYHVWSDNIKKEALIQYNQVAMQQTIAAQNKIITEQTALAKIQQDSVAAVKAQNDQLNTKINNINAFLDSTSVVKQYQNTHSSMILQETFDQLNLETASQTPEAK